MNQLKAKFGSDFEKVGVNLKIDFEAVNKGEKQIEVVDFKQVYYTANFDAPKNPSDVFASGVTVDQLKARGIDEKYSSCICIKRVIRTSNVCQI